MAIARPTRPRVIVRGFVDSVRGINSKPTPEKPAREFKKLVTLDQNGPQLQLDVWLRDGEPLPFIPGKGEPWVILVEVSESTYGASLSFVRALDRVDLDEIAGELFADSSAAK